MFAISLGWIPDTPDQRDRVFKATAPVKLSNKIDLSGRCTPVYNQGLLGSCTANATAAAIDFCLMKEGRSPLYASRLFLYYLARLALGTVQSDSGATIRDSIKAANKMGACPEKSWPYEIHKFWQTPPQNCFDEAAKTKVLAYERLNNTDIKALKTCLAEGFPFVFGFSTYEAFGSASVALSGKLDLPKPTEAMTGGHAVLCVGYNDSTKRFIVRNSWGKEWGQKGYFTIPYAYLTNPNLAEDFWKITVV